MIDVGALLRENAEQRVQIRELTEQVGKLTEQLAKMNDRIAELVVVVRIPADLGSGSDLIWAPFRSAWALGRSAATGGGQVGG